MEEEQVDSPMYIFLQTKRQLAKGPFKNTAAQQFRDLLGKADQIQILDEDAERVKDIACFLLHKEYGKDVSEVEYPIVSRFSPGSIQFVELEAEYIAAQQRLQQEEVHPAAKMLHDIWSILGCMNIQNRQNFLLAHSFMQIQSGLDANVDRVVSVNKFFVGNRPSTNELAHTVWKTAQTAITNLARNARSNT